MIDHTRMGRQAWPVALDLAPGGAKTDPARESEAAACRSRLAPLSTVSILAAAALLLGGCASGGTAALSPAPRPTPQLERLASEPGFRLEEVVRPATVELLGPVSYDLPVEPNSWVESEMNFLMTERRDVIEHWMERGDFYKEFVQQVFRENGIPTDLYHLALIESGFVPTARSSAGAVGVWQFMSATGRELGLRIESGLDERMDPIRSTRAAARHLRSLYRLYGDWTLAAAAYNAGSGRISRGLQQFGVASFWDLAQYGDLAEETRHYVPRLFAMTIIHRNRERLGISASGDVGFAFDSVHVDYETPLTVLAEIGKVPAAELSAMNPHLTSGSAPAGGYWVWVPRGFGESIQQAYMDSDFRRGQGLASYEVKWGDSLSRIAQRSGLAASRIRQLNPSIDFDRLMAGSTIKLPASAARQLLAASAEADKSVVLASAATSGGTGAPDRAGSGATHEVRAGDTLWDIARKYGVSVEEIQNANSLDGQIIRAGQDLRIPAAVADAGGSASEATSVDHVVKSGDTLSEIAERYGSSVGAIQRENGLGSGPIRPGQVLTVPL